MYHVFGEISGHRRGNFLHDLYAFYDECSCTHASCYKLMDTELVLRHWSKNYHTDLPKLDFCKQGSAAVAATETLVEGRKDA
ncbi:uncharacterized protein ARMOST_13937 [Armillaria ostoyae]|uniref:Uncharacterized protein n=1 Tax=Armillaria ostoyae TaxID=47428 RepID=A0A284RP61_ARMOS|nr:uncharacterized protein ARMOST_13937 [Armillaria ostoyae]